MKKEYPYVKRKGIKIENYANGDIHFTPFVDIVERGIFNIPSTKRYYVSYQGDWLTWEGFARSLRNDEGNAVYILDVCIEKYFKKLQDQRLVSSHEKYL